MFNEPHSAVRDSLALHLRSEPASQPGLSAGAGFRPQSFPQSRERQPLHTLDDTFQRFSPPIGFLTRQFRGSACRFYSDVKSPHSCGSVGV